MRFNECFILERFLRSVLSLRVWRSWRIFFMSYPSQTSTYSTLSASMICLTSLVLTFLVIKSRQIVSKLGPASLFVQLMRNGCVCRFLNEVQSCSSSNKMNVQNLATVFGPNILRAKAEDPQSIMGGKLATVHFIVFAYFKILHDSNNFFLHNGFSVI